MARRRDLLADIVVRETRVGERLTLLKHVHIAASTVRNVAVMATSKIAVGGSMGHAQTEQGESKD